MAVTVAVTNTMPRFSVYRGDVLIGWSGLEAGDPPMGVAIGRFFPAPEYSQFREDIVAATARPSTGPMLSVRDSDGQLIETTGGVHITDFGGDEDDIEVTVLGVIHPSYVSLFPEHVAAYERQFPRDG